MRKKLLSFCLSLLAFSSLSAQPVDIKELHNNWYLIKTNQGKSLDTLTFARDRADSSYKMWYFIGKDTLNISEGYEIGYKPELKKGENLVLCSSSDYYRYKLEKPNRLLLYSNNKQSGEYSIQQLNKTSMLLIGYTLTDPQKAFPKAPETNYYLGNINADSSIFEADTITFYKKRIASNSPDFVIDGVKFDFNYNIQIDTIKIFDVYTNKMNEKIILKAKQLQGKWEKDDKLEKVKITFSNGSSINYRFIDKGTMVYLVRIRH